MSGRMLKVLDDMPEEDYVEFLKGMSSLAFVLLQEMKARNADNYVSMAVGPDDEGQLYSLSLSKENGKRPADLVMEMRADLKELFEAYENGEQDNVMAYLKAKYGDKT
jgi:hypothetical protein